MKNDGALFVKEPDGRTRLLEDGIFVSISLKTGQNKKDEDERELQYFEGARSTQEADGRIGIPVKNIQTKHRTNIKSTL